MMSNSPVDPEGDGLVAPGGGEQLAGFQPEAREPFQPSTPEEQAGPGDDVPMDWRDQWLEEARAWADELEELPEADYEGQPSETPDLYSLFELWTASHSEARKANRRATEAFGQWGEVLSQFQQELRALREQSARMQERAGGSGMSREHCLALAELLDRALRVGQAFERPPSGSWFGGTEKWRKAWQTQRQAFSILTEHFGAMLRREGVEKMEVEGASFDPLKMIAVAAELDLSKPHHTVVEELAAGYLLRGEVLRPAQVRVSVTSDDSSKT